VPPALPIAWYSILGVPVAVASDVGDALERVDETYQAFRRMEGAPDTALVVWLWVDGAGWIVADSGGYSRRWLDRQPAILDLLGRIVQGVLARLHDRGMYAIHAGAVVYGNTALIIAGKSGQGKTSFVLGLLQRGLGLLSDEFAILAPGSQAILPYRRSIHIRPGTPELIPALESVRERPRHQLGGGIEWAVTPGELDQIFPGCLAEAAPLRFVLLLDGIPSLDTIPSIVPMPAAVATMELLRGTWAASRSFGPGLERVSRAMHGTICGRLQIGPLDATLDCVTDWLEANHG
jgi:hypothetical protein